MNVLWSILAFLFMLNIIVIIHEGGHFLAARACGVHCHEFSIGMGPVLYQRKGKNTLFSIRWLPIGGYVMMAGEEDGSQDEEQDDWLKEVPENERLNNKPKWQQIFIMLAGVTMNFILAFLLMIGVTAASGYVVDDPIPVAVAVTEDMPAAAAGLQPGDRIVSVTASDGSMRKTNTLNDLSEFLVYNKGESTFEIERNGENFEVKMTPQVDEETGLAYIGIQAENPVRRISFWEAIPEGIKATVDMGASIFRSFGMLFQGKGLDSLSGPVGMYKVTDQIVSAGWLPYIALFALISLNIGIFNLIPLPALDGGRVLILVLESIFRRKIPTKIVEGVILASFVILIGLMVFATYNDLVRYFF